jgi:RNA polymerase sigma-70 factor (ECF subfamily)
MPTPHRLYADLSDNDLFRLVKDRNSLAFDELYHRWKPVLLDWAHRRLQCRESAEDLVHDLFLSFYMRSSTLTFTVSLQAYLHTAIRYKVHNTIRSKITHEKYLRKRLAAGDRSTGDAPYVEFKEYGERVERTLRSLPPQCRKVFELSREEDYSYKDISGRLGISLSTVEKHVSKALRILRKNVQPEY